MERSWHCRVILYGAGTAVPTVTTRGQWDTAVVMCTQSKKKGVEQGTEGERRRQDRETGRQGDQAAALGCEKCPWLNELKEKVDWLDIIINGRTET